MPVPKRSDFWIQQSTKNISFESQYVLGKEIGRGAMSTVFKCERKGLGHTWAVKILHKNIEKKVCTADVGLLLKLDHRNLIRMKEVFETKSQILIVQELVTGGELFDRVVNVGVYSELVAAKAIRDIISGLNYLHSCGYVVRNLKPENLLYENLSEDSKLKIADFALSSIISPEVDMSSVCGAPGYAAPELLKGERNGKAGDMWSVGVILYILLCGYEPFKNDNPALLFKQILKGQYEFPSPDWEDISFNGQDIVRKLLVLDPAKRLTAPAALRNCWVNTGAVKTTAKEEVVEKLKEFNNRRREKVDVLPVTPTPRGSRMCSRATTYPEDDEALVPVTPAPEIQVTDSDPEKEVSEEASPEEPVED